VNLIRFLGQVLSLVAGVVALGSTLATMVRARVVRVRRLSQAAVLVEPSVAPTSLRPARYAEPTSH
jgi:hypothetical protein